VHRPVQVGNGGALGDLDDDPCGIDADLLRPVGEPIGQLEIVEQARRQVDRIAGVETVRLPLAGLVQALPEQIVGKRADYPVSLGHRQEQGRREQPAPRMPPTDQ